MKIEPKGAKASAVQRRKQSVLKRISLPPEALPGSLALTHRRCGRKGCHCAIGKGHPVWSLTYMKEGKKHVERVPDEWVEYVRQRVEESKEFRANVNQVFVANAELLVLLRKQKRES